jgi:RNA polymerase sigma-70 factor (ECF subfamily)
MVITVPVPPFKEPVVPKPAGKALPCPRSAWKFWKCRRFRKLSLGPQSASFFKKYSRGLWTARQGAHLYYGDPTMNENRAEPNELIQQAAAGDAQALNQLFSLYRDRLRWMVRLRLNRRLQGRIDPSDILQDAYLEICKGLPEYLREPKLPFFLWLRHVTGQKLIAAHRHHLGAQMRDAAQEVSLYRGALPETNSVSLAAQLLGRMSTASRAAVRAEDQLQVQAALNSMDPLDREVLALRHFEMLSNEETAQVLDIKKSAASNRYIRALKRLKDILAGIPGFFDSV